MAHRRPIPRFIHPSIWNSDQFCRLPVLARLLFIGIISTADDDGRRKGSPSGLRGDIFPQDDTEVEAIRKARDNIVAEGLARLYVVDGVEYLDLPKWTEYQKPKHHIASDLPAFDVSLSKQTSGPFPPETARSGPIRPESARGLGSGLGLGSERDREKPLDQPSVDRVSADAGFDAFWTAYPRKVGKGAARKAWAKIRPTNGLSERIVEAVEVQRSWPDWTKDGGQFIPHPATWLNQGRWEDEGAAPITPPKPVRPPITMSPMAEKIFGNRAKLEENL